MTDYEKDRVARREAFNSFPETCETVDAIFDMTIDDIIHSGCIPKDEHGNIEAVCHRARDMIKREVTEPFREIQVALIEQIQETKRKAGAI